MWFAEACRMGESGKAEDWTRLPGGPWKHQELAKRACKIELEANRHNSHSLMFRIVRDDDRATIDAESRPPHTWRMKWTLPRVA